MHSSAMTDNSYANTQNLDSMTRSMERDQTTQIREKAHISEFFNFMPQSPCSELQQDKAFYEETGFSISDALNAQLFPARNAKITPFATDLYQLLPQQFHKRLSLLISLNLLFAAPIWNTLAALANHLGKAMKKKFDASEMLPEKLTMTEFKRLLFIKTDNLLLNLHLQLDFCKRARRNEWAIVIAFQLNGLHASRIMLKLKDEEGDFVYLFAEKVVDAQDSFKMDSRFKPLVGLEDDGQVVEDVTKLDALIDSPFLQVFVLTQEQPGHRSKNLSRIIRASLSSLNEGCYSDAGINMLCANYLESNKNVVDPYARWIDYRTLTLIDIHHGIYKATTPRMPGPKTTEEALHHVLLDSMPTRLSAPEPNKVSDYPTKKRDIKYVNKVVCRQTAMEEKEIKKPNLVPKVTTGSYHSSPLGLTPLTLEQQLRLCQSSPDQIHVHR